MILKIFGLGWTLFKFAAVTTVLTQFVLLSAMLAKGFLSQKKIENVRAVYAGVDYKSIRQNTLVDRLKKERDPYRSSKTELIDSRKTAIDRQAGIVSLSEIKLRDSGQRFEVVEKSFGTRVTQLESDISAARRDQLETFFKNMDVNQQKEYTLDFIKNGGLDDALYIVKQMDRRSQKRFFGTFKTDEERQQIATILNEVRKGN